MDHWLPGQREQRLRNVQRQRPEPRPWPKTQTISSEPAKPTKKKNRFFEEINALDLEKSYLLLAHRPWSPPPPSPPNSPSPLPSYSSFQFLNPTFLTPEANQLIPSKRRMERERALDSGTARRERGVGPAWSERWLTGYKWWGRRGNFRGGRRRDHDDMFPSAPSASSYLCGRGRAAWVQRSTNNIRRIWFQIRIY